MSRQRITEAFARAGAEGRGAFVAYLTVGHPTLEGSMAAVDDVIASGADIVELGVPFSDPFADGGTIRGAAYEALKQGVTLKSVLAFAGRVRARHPDTGLVVFSYYNPIVSMGLETFAEVAGNAGIDAVLVVDLPLEERGELLGHLARRGMGFIPLVAPNTPLARVSASEEGLANSFLYIVTVKGITGARSELPGDLSSRLDAIRSVSHLPIAAGFGISTKRQAAEVCRHADGFVAGSALVKCVAEGRKPCLAP
ncbi:MAG: tryptophan synthase subunit alpha [Kiritimatiellae bacterium]|nr:tryptophan synthase subunit alpha [Kiritimatiellia bacterium]